MITLSELLDFAGKQARRVLIEDADEELTAMYHLVAPEGENDLVIACPWRNQAEKDQAFAFVRKHAHEMGAVAALFFSEAWVVTRTPETWSPATDDPPSQQPDRREVVFAVATDGRETVARTWRIERNRPGGAIIALVQDDKLSAQGGEFSGRLLDGILP